MPFVECAMIPRPTSQKLQLCRYRDPEAQSCFRTCIAHANPSQGSLPDEYTLALSDTLLKKLIVMHRQ